MSRQLVKHTEHRITVRIMVAPVHVSFASTTLIWSSEEHEACRPISTPFFRGRNWNFVWRLLNHRRRGSKGDFFFFFFFRGVTSVFFKTRSRFWPVLRKKKRKTKSAPFECLDVGVANHVSKFQATVCKNGVLICFPDVSSSYLSLYGDRNIGRNSWWVTI